MPIRSAGLAAAMPKTAPRDHTSIRERVSTCPSAARELTAPAPIQTPISAPRTNPGHRDAPHADPRRSPGWPATQPSSQSDRGSEDRVYSSRCCVDHQPQVGPPQPGGATTPTTVSSCAQRDGAFGPDRCLVPDSGSAVRSRAYLGTMPVRVDTASADAPPFRRRIPSRHSQSCKWPRPRRLRTGPRPPATWATARSPRSGTPVEGDQQEPHAVLVKRA